MKWNQGKYLPNFTFLLKLSETCHMGFNDGFKLKQPRFIGVYIHADRKKNALCHGHTDRSLVEMFHNYDFKECLSVEKLKLWLLIQWNLDLRKILGVIKIFLKSRFFLISNTRKPLQKHSFAKWTSETIQMSYCSNIVKCFWLYL